MISIPILSVAIFLSIMTTKWIIEYIIFRIRYTNEKGNHLWTIIDVFGGAASIFWAIYFCLPPHLK